MAFCFYSVMFLPYDREHGPNTVLGKGNTTGGHRRMAAVSWLHGPRHPLLTSVPISPRLRSGGQCLPALIPVVSAPGPWHLAGAL